MVRVLPAVLAGLLALSWRPVPASAGEAEDVAVATHNIRQKYCAEAATGKNTEVAIALKEIMPVFVQVSEVYDRTQEDFLLYWRGVLQECIGQEELAKPDLEAFLASKKAVADFPDLARDARRRLRRMETATTRKAAAVGSRKKAPLFVLGVGAGVQDLTLIGTGVSGFTYFSIPVDLSVRLVGPLRLLAYARIGLGDRYKKMDDAPARYQEDERSLLPIFGLGAVVRIKAPVLPRFGALLQLAPNPEGGEDSDDDTSPDDYGGTFLVGVAGLVGVDIPLGTEHFLFRPQVEVGVLGTMFAFRATLGVAFASP